MSRNRSENYEFFQAVSHFSYDTAKNKQVTIDAANKIYSLYVSETAPLKVVLEDEIRQNIKKVLQSLYFPLSATVVKTGTKCYAYKML